MRIISPTEVSEPQLHASNIALDDAPEWSAGTYEKGNRVLDGIEVFEALIGTADSPADGVRADPPTWLRLGYCNRWRMFTEGVDSYSSRDGEIDVTVIPAGLYTAVAVLGVAGYEVEVTVTDATDGVVYNRTESVVDYAVGTFWDYCFLPYESRPDHIFTDIPPYPGAELRIVVRGVGSTDPVRVGRVSIGHLIELGCTLYGTSVSRLSTGTRERDGFGNLRLVKRRNLRVVDYRVVIDGGAPAADYTERQLSRIADTPCVAIGSTMYQSTIVFGVYSDFRIDLSGPSVSEATIEFEEF